MFLNGAGAVKVQIILGTITGLTTIGLKVYLVKQIGVIGIPLATTATYLVLTAVPLFVIVPKLMSAQKGKAAIRR